MQSRYYTRRLFIILFVSFFFISVIPLSIIGVTWLRTSSTVSKQLGDTNAAMIEQLHSNIDSGLSEVERVYTQIYSNQQIQTIMYTSSGFAGTNTLRAVNLINDMGAYIELSDLIDMVFVYFSSLDKVVSNTTSATPELFYTVFFKNGMTYDEWLALLKNPHPSMEHRALNSENGKRYAGFLFSLPMGTNDRTLGTICLMVEEEKFLRLLNPLQDAYVGSMAYVLSAHNGMPLFSQGTELWEDVNTQIQQQESDTVILREQNYAVFSSQSSRSWLIALIQDSQLNRPMKKLDQSFFFSLMLSTFLSVSMALMLAFYVYRPLRSIVQHVAAAPSEEQQGGNPLTYMESNVRKITDQNKQLRELAIRSRQMLRSTFLTQLLNNTYDRNYASFQRDCEQFGVDLKQDYFCVLMIHVEQNHGQDGETDETPENASGVWYILSDIVESLDENDVQHVAITVSYEHNCLFLLLNGAQPRDITAMETATSIKNIIEQEYAAVVTIGVGSVEQGYDHIYNSKLNAQCALDYRMVMGISSIIDYQSVPQNFSIAIYYEYTSEMENKLMNTVRAGNLESANNIIDELFGQRFDQLPITTIRCILYDLIITTIRLVNELGIRLETIFGENDPVEYLGNCETLEQSRERFYHIYDRLCTHVNSRKRSHNDELRVAIEQYIAQHYNDENLCQQMIADEFGKSANYLSYFFKEQTGEKMISYISNIRVRHAMTLLRDTELSVKDIASQTGFGNDLNFIRVFKKVRGETPGQYRKRMSES